MMYSLVRGKGKTDVPAQAVRQRGESPLPVPFVGLDDARPHWGGQPTNPNANSEAASQTYSQIMFSQMSRNPVIQSR